MVGDVVNADVTRARAVLERLHGLREARLDHFAWLAGWDDEQHRVDDLAGAEIRAAYLADLAELGLS